MEHQLYPPTRAIVNNQARAATIKSTVLLHAVNYIFIKLDVEPI